MPEVLVPRDDAIDRVVATLRERLESALKNGQRVRIDARDRASSPLMPMNASLQELLLDTQPDGSFQFHLYIEAK